MRRADERLAAVLAALAPDDAADAEVPEDVLRAFAENAPVDSARRSGARTVRFGRAAALKVAVVVLAVSSGTVAAAAADALPGPAQRAAHSLLGGWGVPAPHQAHPFTPSSPAASPSASAGASASSAVAARAVQPSASHGVTLSPSASASCTGANAHAASGHCAGRPTATAEHRHTPSPHGSAAH